MTAVQQGKSSLQHAGFTYQNIKKFRKILPWTSHQAKIREAAIESRMRIAREAAREEKLEIEKLYEDPAAYQAWLQIEAEKEAKEEADFEAELAAEAADSSNTISNTINVILVIIYFILNIIFIYICTNPDRGNTHVVP